MKVNVLLATYNGMPYVCEQIESILKQCVHKNVIITIYVSDDGSNDNTVNIIKTNYPSVIILNINRKGGVVNNFKYLIDYVPLDADLYFFSDQDDVWNLNKISIFISQYDLLNDKNNVHLLHSDLEVVDKNLSIINKSMFDYQGLNKQPSFSELLVQNSVTGCSMALNHAAMIMAKKLSFDNIIMHDWYLALCCSSIGQITFIPETTIKYRQHGNNQVGAKSKSLLKYCFSPSCLIEGYNKINNSIMTTQQQARAISDFCFSCHKEEDANISLYYANFNKYSFFKRCAFIYKYKIRKYGFIKNFIFMLFLFLQNKNKF